MRTLLCLLLIATTFNARAATYLLLSQTNALAQGITNQAKAYTDAHSGGGSAPTGTIVASGTNAAGMVLTAADDKGTNGVWSDPIWFYAPYLTVKNTNIISLNLTNDSTAPTHNSAPFDITITDANTSFGMSGLSVVWKGTGPDYVFPIDATVTQDAPGFPGSINFCDQSLVTGLAAYVVNQSATNGAHVGVDGLVQGTSVLQVGVAGTAFPNIGGIVLTNIGVYGLASSDPIGAPDNAAVGLLGVIGTQSTAPGGVINNLRNSALFLDVLDTGGDLIIGRTNNSTVVFRVTSDGSIAAGSTNQWKPGDYFTNYVELTVNSNSTRLVTEDNSGNVTIPGTLHVDTATFTNFTATHLTVSDITASNKLVSTSPTTTALTNGYAAAITNTWGIFTGNAQSVVDGSANLSAKGDIVTANIGTGTVTNNLSVSLASGITNYIDFTYATRTNAIGVPITFSFATNGLAGYEISHTRYFLNTSSSNITLTIPSGWKTNMAQTVCAALTNGVTTVMYVKAIGDTSSSTLQTNVYVSFEYYK